MIALTFDDGPDPEWTPQVLGALARAQARATFFPLSPRAQAHPELIARIRAEGHAVGLHGWGHLKHPECSRDEVAADTARALSVFEPRPRWWRLPYGMAAPCSAELAAEHGLDVAGWTHDTHDWRGDAADAMLAAALPALRLGAIVLLHDGLGPGMRRPTCEQTVALVEPLLAEARSRGLEPVTLDELGAVPSGRPGYPGGVPLAVDPLEQIAAGAAARDRCAGVPPFPAEAFDLLGEAGRLEPRGALADQIAAVRAVSRADGAVGRIFDGHVNAQERLGTTAFDGLLGVWGADPAPGEGEPARIEGGRLYGVKTFCSGAGGLDRALVLIRGDLVHVDLSAGAEVDESWYRSAGLRASASHRVRFDGARVLGELGPITASPWFARDAIRTSATWAGLADAAFAAAVAVLASKGGASELVGLAVGRMRTSLSTIDLWMAEAGRSEAPSAAFATHLRDAVSCACRALVDEAVRACGSRPLATGGDLDRAKRDLDVFLLQHRLDPLVARAGLAELDAP